MPQSSRSIGPIHESLNAPSVNDSNTSSDDSIRLDKQPVFPDGASRFNILADESVEDTAEYTDAEYMQKIATLDFLLGLQHEYIVKLGIRCIMDRLQKRKGQGIRKKLLTDTKRRRDANRERRMRILERMEDQQNKHFLNAPLVGVFLPTTRASGTMGGDRSCRRGSYSIRSS